MSLQGESILLHYCDEIEFGGFAELHTATAYVVCPVTGEDREILTDLGWQELLDQRVWKFEWWS